MNKLKKSEKSKKLNGSLDEVKRRYAEVREGRESREVEQKFR